MRTSSVNGTAKTFSPTTDWGGAGGGGYKSGVQKDSDGRYKVAVGPKVLDPTYPDNGKIWDSDFTSLNSNILVVLELKGMVLHQIHVYMYIKIMF